MELNSTLIQVQGVFLSLEKQHGPLQKIRYKGGNENTISHVITEFQKFLIGNHYIKDKSVNPILKEELQKVFIFMIVNTELQHPVEDEDFAYLTNVMPQISKCLLSQIVLGLDLGDVYTSVLRCKFISIVTTEELLSEIGEILSSACSAYAAPLVYEVLALIIDKTTEDGVNQFDDDAQKLVSLACFLTHSFTGIASNVNMVKELVYEQMGHNLWYLLDLLAKGDRNNALVAQIIEKLITSSCDLMRSVTLDVFCYWVEVEFKDEVLQTLVTSKAYRIIEEYQKYAPAERLISMLSAIASKPKSLNEQIHLATIPDMVKMVAKCDQNQKQWFRALLNHHPLENEEALTCIESHCTHLASPEDVSLLLDEIIVSKSDRGWKLALKCAALLELPDLILVVTRHFHKNGLCVLNRNTQQQTVLIFNKLKDSPESQEQFSKEIYLLLLQNPEETLHYIFGECLKSTFYSQVLTQDLATIKEFKNVKNVGNRVLAAVLTENKLSEQNFDSFLQLFHTVLSVELVTPTSLLEDLIYPQIEASSEDFKLIHNYLEIINLLNLQFAIEKNTQGLVLRILEIISHHRSLFLDFHLEKQEIVKSAVSIALKWATHARNQPDYHPVHLPLLQPSSDDNKWSVFYKKQFLQASVNWQDHFLPACDFGNNAKVMANIMKVLPISVAQEWGLAVAGLMEVCGFCRTIEILCDCLILLSHLVKSQESQQQKILAGLKYCLQNFGQVIQECVRPKIENVAQDCQLTKEMCRLLKEIPANLKLEEGVNLANLLSVESLKSLKDDNKFAYSVAAIGEPVICRMLGQKILS